MDVFLHIKYKQESRGRFISAEACHPSRWSESVYIHLNMSFGQLLYTIVSLVVVLAIIAVFWTIMWKFVFEPNPLIRDFFDLDQATKIKNKKK